MLISVEAVSEVANVACTVSPLTSMRNGFPSLSSGSPGQFVGTIRLCAGVAFAKPALDAEVRATPPYFTPPLTTCTVIRCVAEASLFVVHIATHLEPLVPAVYNVL